MTKTIALICALSLSGLPALSSAAFAQDAPEPMKGADPMSGSASDKSMDKGTTSKSEMSKTTMSKKSMKKHQKAM